MPNPNGRPRRWTDAAELDRLVDEYFTGFDIKEQESEGKSKKAPNLFGLCLFTEMSYDCFLDYENGSMDTETQKFSLPLQKARLECLNYAGEHAYTHPAGSVFTHVNLTKKFKEPWKNAQANEVTGTNGGAISIRLLKADETL